MKRLELEATPGYAAGRSRTRMQLTTAFALLPERHGVRPEHETDIGFQFLRALYHLSILQ